MTLREAILKFTFVSIKSGGMYSEAKKLWMIEAIIKSKNDSMLKAIENIVDEEAVSFPAKTGQSFQDLVGLLTPEEADAMSKTIEEHFEKVNPDDWK